MLFFETIAEGFTRSLPHALLELMLALTPFLALRLMVFATALPLRTLGAVGITALLPRFEFFLLALRALTRGARISTSIIDGEIIAHAHAKLAHCRPPLSPSSCHQYLMTSPG
jgi:hypothetical protein